MFAHRADEGRSSEVETKRTEYPKSRDFFQSVRGHKENALQPQHPPTNNATKPSLNQKHTSHQLQDWRDQGAAILCTEQVQKLTRVRVQARRKHNREGTSSRRVIVVCILGINIHQNSNDFCELEHKVRVILRKKLVDDAVQECLVALVLGLLNNVSPD